MVVGSDAQVIESSATAELEAYRHLHSALRFGRYRAGDRLIPEDIAAEIGMSRMPVREAFRRLAADGLVVIRPNRGCIVAGLTLDEIYETFEIRSVLEGLAVRLAMPRIDVEVIADLERLLDRMERAGLSGSSDWVARHNEFHTTICALSGRPKLMKQIAALHVTIEPYLRIWFDYVEKPLSAREEHSSLIEALRTGDAVFAETAMQKHILGTAPMLAEFASPNRR
jgi:DNA-binding GntR family transcriptional regulator